MKSFIPILTLFFFIEIQVIFSYSKFNEADQEYVQNATHAYAIKLKAEIQYMNDSEKALAKKMDEEKKAGAISDVAAKEDIFAKADKEYKETIRTLNANWVQAQKNYQAATIKAATEHKNTYKRLKDEIYWQNHSFRGGF